MTAGEATLHICGVVVLGLGLTGMPMRPQGGVQGGTAAQPGPDNPQSPGLKQQQWTTYRNERWGFCIAYPSGLLLVEGFNGAGVSASPPQEGSAPERSTISAGALPNQLVNLTSGAPRTLEQNFEIDLNGLRESHVEHIEVLQEQRAEFSGHPALVTAIRWADPASRGTWVEETFWIIKNQVVYAVELKCPQSEFRRMEPIYKKMRKTLVLDCHVRADTNSG